MTRKEEIEQAAEEYYDEVKYLSDLSAFPIAAFKAGAEWADRTMFDKVCKVIEKILPNYVELNYVFDEISVNYHKFKNNFISDLRKQWNNE